MTQQEAKDFWPLIKAWAEGKELQVKSYPSGEWQSVRDPYFSAAVADYRIKPEPKLRPWKIEEVPVGAVIRHKTNVNNKCIIVGTDSMTNRVRAYEAWHSLESFLLENEFTLDGGKTWLPCGVME